MKFERFELAVLALASRGVRLTVPNVAVQLDLEPGKTEEWLDRMAYEARLDVELDETEGFIFYRVRGLTPVTTAMARYTPSPVLTSRRRTKSSFWGALLGLLVPGLGLLYAAPIKVVLLASVAILLAVKMLAVIPLLGPLLSSVALGVCALASAVLGALYAKQYNRSGRRAHLEREHVVAHTARWPEVAASAVNSAFRKA